jgi:hypothetical protein
MGIFAEWQVKYAAVEIATVPVDPETKISRMSWQRIGLPASKKLAQQERHRDCNGIGFACGRYNGITVLDVDTTDEQVLREALRRHGDTSIIERTASGKFHVWYRHNGEPRSCKQEGLSKYQKLWGEAVPIDLLGAGLSVAAPTFNTHGAYTFLRGGLEDVRRLPIMRGVDDLRNNHGPVILPDDVEAIIKQPTGQKITEGSRDTSLWRACMAHAKRVQTFDELLTFARALNEENMAPALADSIVIEKACSAWKYEQMGLNTFGQRAVIIPGRLSDAGPDVQWLFAMLQRDYFWLDVFPVPKDYAKRRGMGWWRQSNAMRELLARKTIRRVSRGGRFEGDAATYAWVRKGEKNGWKVE